MECRVIFTIDAAVVTLPWVDAGGHMGEPARAVSAPVSDAPTRLRI